MSTRATLIGLLVVGMALIVTACGPAATTAVPTSPPPTQLPAPTTKPPAPTTAPTVAPTTPPALPPLVGDPIRGGLLYDAWWAVLELDKPTTDQPLWKTQTTNTRSGADTWRCKECHGWDYLGKDGRYGSGSHATGFPGVMGVAGTDPNQIRAMLEGSTNPDHDFSTMMDEQALTDLALFLSQGLIDDSTIVSDDAAPVNGNAIAGQTLFEDNCAACHGPQGTAINFAGDDEPEYIGTLGLDNPWEFLHKVRLGQPGVPSMSSGLDPGWTTQDYADMLAYVQGLPTQSLVAEVHK